jgi:hypothetical protein
MVSRHIVPGTAGVLLALGVLFGSFGVVHAKGQSDAATPHVDCTNATLKGRYAVIGSGFIPGAHRPRRWCQACM